MRFLLPLLLMLGGCAELAATAIEDARDIHTSAKSYITEVHDWRRDIRRACREIVIKKRDMLIEEGRFDEALELLAANYPSLVSVKLVKQAMDDPENMTSEPFGCNPGPRVSDGTIEIERLGEATP